MQDPTTAALELLCVRGQTDAARALARCTIFLRHEGTEGHRRAGALPQADVLIHAPADVLTQIRHKAPPQGDYASQIERAVTDVLHSHFRTRAIQWTETDPAAGVNPEGSEAGTRGGRAGAAVIGRGEATIGG